MGPTLHEDWRWRAARWCLVLVVSVGWLVSPKPESPKEYCGLRVELTSWAGFTLNCDAGGFVAVAWQPSRLLEPGNLRQSRPVFAWIGHVIGWPIAQCLGLVAPGMDPRIGYVVGYVALNFLFLFAAVECFAWLLGRVGVTPWESFLLSVFLVANDLTKAFQWTPHSQLLGLFMPVATIAVAFWLLERRPDASWLVGLGAVTGSATLAYGAGFASLAVFLLVVAWVDVRDRGVGGFPLGRVMALGLPALALLAAWPAWVRAVAGSFYSHELSGYRQFVWLGDAWRAGGEAGWAKLVLKAQSFTRTLRNSEVLPVLVFCAALAMAGRRWREPAEPIDAVERLRWATSAQILIAGSFLALMGYYETRLTYAGLVPGMIVFAGIGMAELSLEARRRVGVGLLLAGLAWWFWHLVKRGPYS